MSTATLTRANTQRVGLYLRISKDHAGDGHGVANQRADCERPADHDEHGDVGDPTFSLPLAHAVAPPGSRSRIPVSVLVSCASRGDR